MLESVNKIETFTQGIRNSRAFYEDEKTFDSVLMNFIVIGESVAKLDESFRRANPQVSRSKIKSFRNFVAHNYLELTQKKCGN